MTLPACDVDLGGRVSLVTGAAGLIGRAIAAHLAGCGASVVVTDVDGPALDEVADGLRRAGGEVFAIAADLLDAETPAALVAEAVARFHRVDVLVNNAALTNVHGAFLDCSPEDVDRVLRVNLWAPLVLAQHASRQMVAQGSGGAIVNITSVGGSARGHDGLSVYDATKGGIDGMTRALATELGRHGIRVNAVGPASVATGAPEDRGREHPLGRGGTPDDIARAVAFLASPAADYISGQILYVDGGLMAALRPMPQAESEDRR